MLALAKESAGRFHQRFAGETMIVLFEQKTGGLWTGYTGNYIRVYVKSSADLTNRLLPVKLGDIRGEGMEGGLCLFSDMPG